MRIRSFVTVFFLLLCLTIGVSGRGQESAGKPASQGPATPLATTDAPNCDEACQQGRQNIALQQRLIWLTGGLVLVGLLQVGSMVWQGIVMNRTKSDVHAQAGLMKTQADLMGQQLDEMRNEAIWSRKVTYDQVLHAGEQSKSSAAAAEAARDSAQAALEQIRLVKSKERANIVVSPPDNLISINFGLPHYQMQIQLENVGQSNALNVKCRAKATLLATEESDSDAPMHMAGTPNIIRVAEKAKVIIWTITGLPRLRPTNLGSPKLKVIIRGTVEFEDVFGDNHETAFVFRTDILALQQMPQGDSLQLTSYIPWFSSDETPDVAR